MHFTLQNEYLRVTIASRGAELVSLKDRSNDLEYLWQATPEVWGRHAPILFPIVGRLNQDQLRWGNPEHPKTYEMKQHGFARDSEFACVEQHHERIRLQLTANEKTRSQFPFEFSLSVSYQLIGNQLHVDYQVKNGQQTPIYFSIGAHPGLTCPILPNSQFDDYELLWEQEETLKRIYLTNGLRDSRTAPLMEQTNRLPLNHELFAEDALIVQAPQSQWIALSHKTRGPVITLHCPNYPYLGIWTKPDPKAEFVCIEPWHGIADSQGFSGLFSQKEGVITLNPAGTFSCRYRFEIHPQTVG